MSMLHHHKVFFFLNCFVLYLFVYIYFSLFYVLHTTLFLLLFSILLPINHTPTFIFSYVHVFIYYYYLQKKHFLVIAFLFIFIPYTNWFILSHYTFYSNVLINIYNLLNKKKKVIRNDTLFFPYDMNLYY